MLIVYFKYKLTEEVNYTQWLYFCVTFMNILTHGVQ